MKLQLTRYTEHYPDSEVYELQSFRYAIYKKMNALGEALSSPCAGLIKVTANAFPSMQLIRWAWGYKYFYDGIVSFTEKKKEKGNILFRKATCTALKLHYKADAAHTVIITMNISADSFSTGETNIINK